MSRKCAVLQAAFVLVWCGQVSAQAELIFGYGNTTEASLTPRPTTLAAVTPGNVTPAPPRRGVCRAEDATRCSDGTSSFCSAQRCDGTPDCPGGEDENCQGGICTPNPCGLNSRCVTDANNRPRCSCLPLHAGRPPSTACRPSNRPVLHACRPSPCGPDSGCTILHGTISCACSEASWVQRPDLYWGCRPRSGPCDPNPCSQGAQCDPSRDPVCFCPAVAQGNVRTRCVEPLMKKPSIKNSDNKSDLFTIAISSSIGLALCAIIITICSIIWCKNNNKCCWKPEESQGGGASYVSEDYLEPRKPPVAAGHVNKEPYYKEPRAVTVEPRNRVEEEEPEYEEVGDYSGYEVVAETTPGYEQVGPYQTRRR